MEPLQDKVDSFFCHILGFFGKVATTIIAIAYFLAATSYVFEFNWIMAVANFVGFCVWFYVAKAAFADASNLEEL